MRRTAPWVWTPSTPRDTPSTGPETPCKSSTANPARGFAATPLRAGLLALLADGQGDEIGDVLRVLAGDQVARHRAVAAGAAVLEGVEDEALGGPQVVQVRPH